MQERKEKRTGTFHLPNKETDYKSLAEMVRDVTWIFEVCLLNHNVSSCIKWQ